MSTEEYTRVNAGALQDFITRVFEKLGVPHEDAVTTADNLVVADLRGIDSHGVARLGRYVGKLKRGMIVPKSEIKIISEAPGAALVDGGNGLGQPAGKWAMNRCIEKAKSAGVCMISVRNSNHFGIAGYYAMMALPHDMIGLSLTNSAPLVVPTYGRQALIGTNPISMAVPAGQETPFVLDMATSVVPRGKLEVYARKEMPIPIGWAVDEEGNPTTNPQAVLDALIQRRSGGIMPLGGTADFSGYKGYGLAVMVDILSGVLSGANFGPRVDEPQDGKEVPSNVGHFFAAINIATFRPVAEFKRTMDEYIRLLKDSPKAKGEDRIYIHGEKEFELAAEYRKTGVPLYYKVVNSLKEIGRDVGVEYNL